MNKEEKIRELLRRTFQGAKDCSGLTEMDERILSDASTSMKEAVADNQRARRLFSWRTIMNSRITKLTAAAVIIITILGGVKFWPDGGSENGRWWLGSPAAWGQEILAELDTIKGISCREQTIWLDPDGRRHTSSTWDIFYVSSDSYRRDIYDGDILREIQWYVPEGDDMIQHYLRFDLKCYGALRHTGSFGVSDPIDRIRFYVGLLDEADELLGEAVIEGRSCVGFEISASKYGDNPREWLDRIWFDVDTKLPVLVEQERGCPRDETQTDYHPHINVMDRFDYNPQLPADTFIPQQAPEGFINAHPDEIRAIKE
ncbi:MAG: hypothetical protein GWN67_17685 [Phycisphaerae bacterium]|nr:hypothetical protein [Phycisphaerae bacterium]NIP52934.1 hypothetical protein [Phycisphaerae bacterium]NIS51985.1 hypothetical protein [Phycisphaerae bacterium]NIU09499.1 hypothetical protein [Phycisphaerae bacterium]NIU58150.1 hypothetical protein [Phycisphaerae bacterium]